jgi:hypothetical protein
MTQSQRWVPRQHYEYAVKDHCKHVRRKTGVPDRAAIIVRVLSRVQAKAMAMAREGGSLHRKSPGQPAPLWQEPSTDVFWSYKG